LNPVTSSDAPSLTAKPTSDTTVKIDRQRNHYAQSAAPSTDDVLE
jgi:hypothetical protein